MDLDSLELHLRSQGASILNEESTKHVLVIPMLKLLGYNPYDINEVISEYPVNKIGRVDYLLKDSSRINMVVEVKKLRESVVKPICQLKDYFDNIEGSNIGITTDGNNYLFFKLDGKKGGMDIKPFLCLSIINNFRSERVRVWIDFIRITKLSKEYIYEKEKCGDEKWNHEYSKIIKEISLIDKSKDEMEGISDLLRIEI